MIHTKETSTKYFEILKKDCNIEFEDSSYGNDSCDSVYNEKHIIQIFFPNTTKEESSYFEDFHTFNIMENENQENTKEFNTIKEVINYLNKNYK